MSDDERTSNWLLYKGNYIQEYNITTRFFLMKRKHKWQHFDYSNYKYCPLLHPPLHLQIYDELLCYFSILFTTTFLNSHFRFCTIVYFLNWMITPQQHTKNHMNLCTYAWLHQLTCLRTALTYSHTNGRKALNIGYKHRHHFSMYNSIQYAIITPHIGLFEYYFDPPTTDTPLTFSIIICC